MTVVIEDGTIHPSAGSIMAIEDVVEVHTEDCFFQTSNVFTWMKGIAEVDIRLRIAWQRTCHVLGIVEILTTDEVCMPYCLKAFVMEIEHTIEYG